MNYKDRERIVREAAAETEKVCRQRRVQCWARGGVYTPEAQEVFNEAYDHFEDIAAAEAETKSKGRKKVWIIVGQDGDMGEGPWDVKQDAQDFLNNEVGVVASLLQVDEDSMGDINRLTKLVADIQYEPAKFRKHL